MLNEINKMYTKINKKNNILNHFIYIGIFFEKGLF
jgi:hypothetical protein